MANEKKVFVDAAQSFKSFIYGTPVALLFSLIFYIPVIRSLNSIFKESGFAAFNSKLFLIFFILMVVFPVFLIIVFFTSIVKYGIYKEIITDAKGVTFVGLFNKKQLLWNDILAQEIDSGLFSRLIRTTVGRIQIVVLQSKHGKLYFPLSIKEKGQEYPMWYRGRLRYKDWRRIKEISPKNCPLYVEIQKHLGNK